MKEIYYIYLDDERNVPPVKRKFGCHIKKIFKVENYQECIDLLNEVCPLCDECWLDLDHDLGVGKTGYDVAKYLVESGLRVKYNVHSMNPVGKKNIEQLLSRYGYLKF